MKRLAKTASILLAILVLLVAVPAVSAAETEVQPGETVTLKFEFADIYGIDGEFSISNPDMLTSVVYGTENSHMIGSVENNLCFLHGDEKVSGWVDVTVVISADAAEGDTCTISFRYETSDEEGNMSEFETATQTVVIPKKDVPTDRPTEPTTPTTPTEPTGTIVPPQPTGESGSLVGGVCLMAAAALAVLMLSKKTEKK